MLYNHCDLLTAWLHLPRRLCWKNSLCLLWYVEFLTSLDYDNIFSYNLLTFSIKTEVTIDHWDNWFLKNFNLLITFCIVNFINA